MAMEKDEAMGVTDRAIKIGSRPEMIELAKEQIESYGLSLKSEGKEEAVIRMIEDMKVLVDEGFVSPKIATEAIGTFIVSVSLIPDEE